MKVCMLLKSDFQSFQYDSRVLREAKALIEAGYHVSVVLYGDRDEKTSCQGIDVYSIGMETERRIMGFQGKLAEAGWIKRMLFKAAIHLAARIFNLEYGMKTCAAAKSCGAHIYHCHDIGTLPIGVKLKRKLPVKVIYDSHELWSGRSLYSGLKGTATKWFMTIKEKRLIRETDVVITVNDSLARILETRYQVRNVHFILNVPDRSDISMGKDLLRQELEIGNDRKIVLYLGALTEGRGLENLVKAWESVQPGITLVLMGFGPLYATLKNLISSAGLEDRVLLKDAVPPREVLKYAGSADLGVMASQNTCLSYYYSSPNKIWEYIAAGIPFLASDFPEMRKLAMDEGMGMVINPDSPQDMADKINYVLDTENRELYTQMKENCICRGMNQYNWDIEKRNLLEIYAGLSAEHSVSLP